MNKNKSKSIVIISLLCLAFYSGLFTTIVSATPAYHVTFSETGLASGITWSVTLDGTTLSSTTSNVVFDGVADGSHSYVINAPSGYDASTASGTVTVSGDNSQQSVTFTSQSYNWWMSGNGVTRTGYTTSPAPLTSNLLWQQIIGRGFMMGMASSPTVVDGVIYLSNNDYNNLDLANATTGALIARYNMGGYIGSSSPAVCNGIIYVGASGTIVALNASTGSSVWSYVTGGTIDSSPAVDNGVLYIGSDDNKAYAFDAADGTLLWSHTTGGSVASSPAVAYGTVFISSNDGNIYALNATSGTELWHYGIPQDSTTSPVVADGIVYASLYDGNGVGKTVALNTTTGAEIWTTTQVDLGTVAIAHGMVYLCTYGGSLCALNATTGSQIWVGSSSDYTRGQPVIAGSMLYYSGMMELHAVNAFTGQEIWYQYLDMFESEGSSPVIANGVLYQSSGWGELYAFGSLTQHTLTMNTVGQGTVNPGNQTYAEGSYVDLEAIPADGWTFSGWSGDVSGTTNTSITIDSNKTVTATFTQNTHSLTMITVGQGDVLPGNQSYTPGTNVDLEAIPANGWIFDSWSGDASGTANTSITLSGDKTVTATFIPLLQLNIAEAVGGTTDLSYGVHIYHYGSEVNITATAAPGYTFSNWIIGDSTNSSNPLTLIMDQNMTITPVFTQTQDDTPSTYTVTFSQTGLAQEVSWSVTFDGITQASTTDTITFTGYIDGDYTYSLTSPSGYTTVDVSGTLTVAGSDVSKTIAFTSVDSTNTIIATDNSSNTTYAIQIIGNVTAEQFSNMTITPNQTLRTTAVDFTLTGPAGTDGFCNITLPKTAIPFGTNPVIYIDGVEAANQLCTQDADNYYITFTTHFSTHQIEVMFTTTTASNQTPLSNWTPIYHPIVSPQPTTTPTPKTSPSPTAIPTSRPSATPTATTSATNQYVAIIAALIVFIVLAIGLVRKKRAPSKPA